MSIKNLLLTKFVRLSRAISHICKALKNITPSRGLNGFSKALPIYINFSAFLFSFPLTARYSSQRHPYPLTLKIKMKNT